MKPRVPFAERGGSLRGLVDLATGGYPAFLFGGPLTGVLPVFHFHEVTTGWLEPRLRFLADNGYRTVNCDQIARFVIDGVDPGPRRIGLTFDDAWYLNGAPWERPELYQSEAALFRLDKVKTPTHIVGGDADDRVSYLEDVLLERGLQRLDVPHELLVFPGENHPLDKNPWHGYIKVREEMRWLDKYVPKE